MNNRSLFPSLKSWIFAIKLAIPAYLGATVVFGFEFWRYSAFAVILAINGNEGLSFCLAISMIALLLCLLWFLFLAGIYKLLLNILWSKPPQWIKLPKLKYLVLRDFSILVISTFPIVVILLVYISFITSFKEVFADMKTPKLSYDSLLLKFSWLWMICAASLYQWCDRKLSGSSK